MLKLSTLWNFILNLLTGAGAVVSLATVAVAYSDRVNPVNHPLLGCAGMLLPFFVAANVALLAFWLLLRWRRAWIPLAALVLSLPAIRIYAPLHLNSTPPEGSIKVLSYNVACYHRLVDGRLADTTDSIVGYIRRQDADIVCLQEDVSHGPAVYDAYQALYPYNDTVHVNRPTSPLINALGLHSRYPILRHERIEYPTEANGSVAFFLLVGTDTVIVINNHLESTHLSATDRERYQDMINGGLTTEDTQAETRFLLGKLSAAMSRRAAQADAVHDYIVRHGSYPIIVCGDFNDTPISYCRRTVAEGLTDCYVETGNGLGRSFNLKGFYIRIDQMMCSRHFTPYHCYVDDSIHQSDHYPIICWMKR